jgi:MFS family permease
MSRTERRRPGGLWRHPDFRKLWAGETVSLLGSEVTELALPLVAVLALHAGAGQMGLLAAARFAPFLLVTLPAGVWVDRRRRRPVLVGATWAAACWSRSCPCSPASRCSASSTSTASPSPSGS